MLRSTIHLALHFIVPGVAARLCFREKWLLAWGIMVLTMLVDLDHLLANPVFDPNRCSIGFHPLHSYLAIGLYLLMVFFRKSRIVGLGLLIHMALDWIDCLVMYTAHL